MSPLSVSPRDRVLLAALLLIALVGALGVSRVAPRERSGSPLEQPSTFFSADYGTKAAYLALGRLGYRERRVRRPLTVSSLAGLRTLFVLGPIVPLGRGEEQTLLDWVHGGHVLVVVPSRTERFNNWLDRSSLDGTTTTPVTETLDPDMPWLSGVEHLSTNPRLRETLSGPAHGPLEHAHTTHFWKDERGTLGLLLSHGDGFVVALADAHPLSNRGLGEADNALLLDGLARLTSSNDRTGAVGFDEYHLGFDEGDASPVALVKLLMVERFRPGVLQVLLVLALGVAGAAWRFGAPIQRVVARRRQHGEFAGAAGRLLLESGAASLVRSKLLSHHRAWAIDHTGLRPDIDDAALDAELGRRAGLDVARLLAESRSDQAASPKDVLRTSRVLYRVRKALSHGTR